jgi:hypothetical protein
MNENPKCHLHIPQPRKGIYVLNIVVQNISMEKKNEWKRPQRNTQNLNALIKVHKHDGGKNLESNIERN